MIYYFGTKLDGSGHVLYRITQEGVSRVEGASYPQEVLGFDPEQFPDRPDQLLIGQARSYHMNQQDMTVMAFLGAPGDKRGGSKSVFVIKKIINTTEMWNELMKYEFARRVIASLLMQTIKP